MKWLSHKHASGGREARQRAERDLERTQEETREVQRLAESLRAIRERNHFAESIAHIYRGGKP